MPIEEEVLELGTITVRLSATEVFRGNYESDLAIDETRINEALKTQPARYIFWARAAALQKAQVKRKKLELERYEGQLDASVRSAMVSAGDKPTEATVRARIMRDQRREELLQSIILAEMKLDHLTAVKEAFGQRKDMLMSLGANLREEMYLSGGLKIKQEEVFTQRRNGAPRGSSGE